jgi:hypothetical protein
MKTLYAIQRVNPELISQSRVRVKPETAPARTQPHSPELVFEATQSKSMRQGTMYGKTPYSVSLTEWER